MGSRAWTCSGVFIYHSGSCWVAARSSPAFFCRRLLRCPCPSSARPSGTGVPLAPSCSCSATRSSPAAVACSSHLLALAGGEPDGRLLGLASTPGRSRQSQSFAAEFAFLAAWFLLLFRLLRARTANPCRGFAHRPSCSGWCLAQVLGGLLGAHGIAGRIATALAAAARARRRCPLAARLSRCPFGSVRPAQPRAAAAPPPGLRVSCWGGQPWGRYAAAAQSMRAATVIAAGLLGYAVRRRPQWSLAIFVSPQIGRVPHLFAMTDRGVVLAHTAVSLARPGPPPRRSFSSPFRWSGRFSQRLSARVRCFGTSTSTVSLLPRRVVAADRCAASRSSCCHCRSA
jgi:hypothetical protein